jgi:hypothetical protein
MPLTITSQDSASKHPTGEPVCVEGRECRSSALAFRRAKNVLYVCILLLPLPLPLQHLPLPAPLRPLPVPLPALCSTPGTQRKHTHSHIKQPLGPGILTPALSSRGFGRFFDGSLGVDDQLPACSLETGQWGKVGRGEEDKYKSPHFFAHTRPGAST